MNIDDQTLSAFLDGELPEADMESIRQRLRDDEHFSERLAELATVDRRVAEHYTRIDERPMPEKILQLLAESKTASATKTVSTTKTKPANVLTFPRWRRGQNADRSQRQHTAIAAAIALAIGFSVAQFFPGAGTTNPNTAWQIVSAGLESAPSGTVTQLANGRQLKPRLTFVNQRGEYCRQFQVSDNAGASESIACRPSHASGENPTWRLAATIELDALPDPGRYQTASGGSLLDGVLDQMMAGEGLDAETEQRLIQRDWQTP